MKIALVILICFLSTRPECQITADTLTGNLTTDLKQLLPLGKIEIDIMGFQMPNGYNELLERIKASIASHQEWYADFIENVNSDQSPGYHPNLGVSEDEWSSFLRMSNEMEMVKFDVGSIEVLQKDSTIELRGIGNTEAFDGFRINLCTKLISTNFDSWGFTKRILSNDGQKLTGMWNGYQWKYQEMDTTNMTDLTKLKGKDYEFSIGQLLDSKKVIIFYKAREFSEGQQYRMADLLVTFDIPKDKK